MRPGATPAPSKSLRDFITCSGYLRAGTYRLCVARMLYVAVPLQYMHDCMHSPLRVQRWPLLRRLTAGWPGVRLLLRCHLPLVPPEDPGAQGDVQQPSVLRRQETAAVLLRPLPAQPARRGCGGGGGVRLLGVPLLPRQLRQGLRHVLQLRAVPKKGAGSARWHTTSSG